MDTDNEERLHRLPYSKPHVERVFEWIEDHQFQLQGLLHKIPFSKALTYARERRSGLEVFLSDPDVPIDTNHLERALRAIPMDRKNLHFCWTELGTNTYIDIVQRLIVTWPKSWPWSSATKVHRHRTKTDRHLPPTRH